MSTPAETVATYLRAKDGNRPHLMANAFAETAVLDMVVRAGSISFPPRCAGIEGITEVLVRRFGQTFENVYTFCLARPPTQLDVEFQCAWLVGMSEKSGGSVRVGCGRYCWQFQPAPPHLAERLTITIERMEALPPSALWPVMRWVSALPYPWCPGGDAARSMPALPQLSAIGAFVRRAQD